MLRYHDYTYSKTKLSSCLNFWDLIPTANKLKMIKGSINGIHRRISIDIKTLQEQEKDTISLPALVSSSTTSFPNVRYL